MQLQIELREGRQRHPAESITFCHPLRPAAFRYAVRMIIIRMQNRRAPARGKQKTSLAKGSLRAQAPPAQAFSKSNRQQQ